jgi:hypothetical protein
LSAGKVQFIRALEVHPEIRGHPEILAETQGGVRCDAPLFRQKLIKTVGRNLKNVGQLFGCDADLLQFVCKDLSGVNGCAYRGLLLSA